MPTGRSTDQWGNDVTAAGTDTLAHAAQAADQVADLIAGLKDSYLVKLLRYVRQWNTNTKHSELAQSILSTVLTGIPLERIMDLPDAQGVIEALIPYTERHYKRLQGIYQSTFFLDYVQQAMKSAGAGEDADVESAYLMTGAAKAIAEARAERMILDATTRADELVAAGEREQAMLLGRNQELQRQRGRLERELRQTLAAWRKAHASPSTSTS